jgi:mannose-6-phosphate isomerase-like protein (cupin superfamily)
MSEELDVGFAALDPEAEMFNPLRRALGVTGFGINQLRLAPKQRMRVHLHTEQEEVYLVLAGELTLVIEGEPKVLGRGELARVGPGVRRQLTNPGTKTLELLALGGSGSHRSRDALAWSSWDEGGEGRDPREVPLPDDLP